MSINEHITSFAGYPVKDFDPQHELQDPAKTIYRLSTMYDSDPERQKAGCLGNMFRELVAGRRFKLRKTSGRDLLNAFLAKRGAAESPGLVTGMFTEDGDTAQILAEAAGRLPNLSALFLGEMIQEECEISWIQQSDFSALLAAYPKLAHLRVRGAEGLSFGQRFEHEALKTLALESGGLSAEVVRQVMSAHLPALEHLELWFGTSEYGGNATEADLQPLLQGTIFPKLKYLGLRNSEMTDEIAQALTAAPILQRIETLDLSMGTLSDLGGKALLDCQAIRKLKKLDLHYHFLSNQMMNDLAKLSLEVDVSEQQQPDLDGDEVHRYVAVSE